MKDIKKAKAYLLEFLVIFVSISFAFLSENWREQLQEKEDYELILEEIHANLLLDSVEFENDIAFIEKQIHSCDRLLDSLNLCPSDSLEYYFRLLMYNYRWPDVKSTGIGQLRNSTNLDPKSGLISEVNNYYTWTEYLKESTPYQYIMPQNVFNEWMIQNELIIIDYNIRKLDTALLKQLKIRLQHLKITKELQAGIYQFGLSKIVHLLSLFDKYEN
jgi:hypothetical protein